MVSIVTRQGNVPFGNEVSREDLGRPEGSLEDLTRRMTQSYFHQLGGHDTRGLYELFITQVERGLLGVVLEHTRGNQTRAAEILGINRGTLRKKLRSCDLR